ncbi:MAG: serine--tRNA ligase [Firmicutes bacterium]|nr:serine--tRNA ligase [Bacillota bacterium]
MLDLKFVRENPQKVKEAIALKGDAAAVDELIELDAQRREILQQTEELKHRRNKASKEIALLKKEGKVQEAVVKMRAVSQEIKVKDAKLREVEEQIQKLLLCLPNIPDDAVPRGKTEDDNEVVRTWGQPKEFSFPPKAHWDLGEELGILDFQRASKITGARFTLYRGLGAQLERALVNLMLDLHTREHGYTEIFPPFMVHRESMVGTGQLPKFAEDAFKVEGTEYYLIPTAEVPVTNLYRGEILEEEQLPLKHVAYSACFRAEAGAHGRDTRGLIRQHQFNKVELVKFVHPQESDAELEKLTNDAEKVLQLLGLPYRVMLMCTGDLGFAAAKKYDLEVWLPSYNAYREISSCSNFRDFQARRAGIRYRPANGGKAQFLHTLNGSGVAIGRTVAAILENYQQEDGSVRIPEVLLPYFPGLKEPVIRAQ